MSDILLAALFFLLMPHAIFGFWMQPSDLTLTSENSTSLFYVGENMTLHCRKTKPFEGPILFKRSNDVIDAAFIRQPSDRYAVMDKPVAAHDYAETRYRCKDNASLSDELRIYTEYRPQKAAHFSMIYLDKASLHMSWTNGQDNITYKNMHITQENLKVIRITAEYRKMPDGPWTLCEGSPVTSCNVNSFTQLDARVSLRVNVTNTKRQDLVSTTLPALKVLEHVKPSPVGVGSCRALSSRSVSCEVTHTWSELRYTATACVQGGPTTPCVQREIPMTSNKMLTVTDLHPNYSYTLTLQAAFDRGYFSEPSSPADVTMPEDDHN